MDTRELDLTSHSEKYNGGYGELSLQKKGLMVKKVGGIENVTGDSININTDLSIISDTNSRTFISNNTTLLPSLNGTMRNSDTESDESNENELISNRKATLEEEDKLLTSKYMRNEELRLTDESFYSLDQTAKEDDTEDNLNIFDTEIDLKNNDFTRHNLNSNEQKSMNNLISIPEVEKSFKLIRQSFVNSREKILKENEEQQRKITIELNKLEGHGIKQDKHELKKYYENKLEILKKSVEINLEEQKKWMDKCNYYRKKIV